MSSTIPGLADRIRRKALGLLGAKKYVYRLKHLYAVISDMSDDDIYAFGPVDVLTSLAATYPHCNADWSAWVAYQKTVEESLTNVVVTKWCEAIIELAIRRKVAA